MDLVEFASAQKSAIVMRGVNISMLAKMLNQAEQNGRAAIELIQSSPVAPVKGAPEPGKGQKLDVVA